MVEQMEFVDVEGIMSEIRTQIKERGYTKKDLKFADMNTSAVLGAEDYYDYPNFRATLEQVDGKRYVPWWNPIKRNKVVVFIKRFIRKCVTFLIAPIVDAQNELNQYTASALVQIGAKFEQEQDYDYDEMQKKIEMLEQRIAELEKSVENNQ